MQTRVSVQTSARLHLGFLDLNGGFGRRFGSFGLAIDRPVTALTIFRARAPSVEGPEAERVAAHIEILRRHLNLSATYGVRIEEAIPAHAGLGSGTQLAFALAAGLRRLEGLPEDFASDALLLQRGGRSGIGAALFSRGGLVVDGGHGPQTVLPPVLCHLPFPEDWRVILVMDSTFAGIHGADEQAAFAALPQFPAAAAADICRRLLMQALPALAERDLAQFGQAVGHIQLILGIISLPPKVAPAIQAPESARSSAASRISAPRGSAKAPGGRPALPLPPATMKRRDLSGWFRKKGARKRRRAGPIRSWSFARPSTGAPSTSRRRYLHITATRQLVSLKPRSMTNASRS